MEWAPGMTLVRRADELERNWPWDVMDKKGRVARADFEFPQIALAGSRARRRGNRTPRC